MDELTPEEELAALSMLDNMPVGDTIKTMMAFVLHESYGTLENSKDSELIVTFGTCMAEMLKQWIGEDPEALKGAMKAMVVMMVAAGSTFAGVVAGPDTDLIEARNVDNVLAVLMAVPNPFFDLVPLSTI